jgi:hypothetical protein
MVRNQQPLMRVTSNKPATSYTSIEVFYGNVDVDSSCSWASKMIGEAIIAREVHQHWEPATELLTVIACMSSTIKVLDTKS